MRKAWSLRVALVAMLVVVALLTAGCPADQQRKAAIAMRDFSVGVKAFQQTEIALFQQGKVEPDIHQRIQQGFLHLSTTAPQIDAAIKANNKAAMLAAIDAGLADTDGFLADIGAVKEPQTRASLQALVLSLRTILANGKVLVS